MKKFYFLSLSLLLNTLLYAQIADIASESSTANLKSASIIKLDPTLKAPALITAGNIIWDNGPLVNSPGTGAGGADESMLQTTSLSMNTLGGGFQILNGFSLADDFILNKKEKLDTVLVYAYQTGSDTVSTITDIHLQIYDGKPDDGGTVIWGDPLTNRLDTSYWTGIYRTTETSSGATNRPIMECKCVIDQEFEAGTYWIEISVAGSPIHSGPWCPVVTLNDSTTTGNALQSLDGSTTWNPFDDSGTLTSQGIPFVLLGTGNSDTIPPVAVCHPISVSLLRNGEYVLTQADIFKITKQTTDNVSDYENLKITVSPSVLTCAEAGEAKVIFTFEDEAGNQTISEATISVENNYPIQVREVTNIEVELPVGACETTIRYPFIGAIGPCVSFKQIEGLGRDGLFPAGTTTEVWEATNTSGRSEILSFTVTVISENKAPTLDSIANVETDEDSAVTINLAGITSGGSCDLDGVTITILNDNSTLISNTTINYISGDTIGSIKIIPKGNGHGSASITVDIKDREGMTQTQTFTLTVNPVNDAPVLLESLSDQAVTATETFEFNLSKLTGVLFDDVDDSTLNYTIALEDGTLPEWITTTDDLDMLYLSATPMQADTGCYSIVVIATDTKGATASDTFELCVEKLVVGISNLDKEIFNFNMYPNPTIGQVTIDINSSNTGEVEVMVVNIVGSEIFRKKYQIGDPIQFDISNHVSGLYMAIVKVGNKQIIKKIILDN